MRLLPVTVVLAIILLGLIVISVVCFHRPYILYRDFLHRLSYPRTRDLDIKRVHDLEDIQSALIRYYKEKGTIPQRLETIRQEPYATHISITDPYTGALYEYNPLPAEQWIPESAHYQICVDFQAPSPLIKEDVIRRCPRGGLCTADRPLRITNPVDPDDRNWYWDHRVGKDCWNIDSTRGVEDYFYYSY